MTALARGEVLDWLQAQLQPERFKDHAPNGLQVEGAARIAHVVCGVTASVALIERAIELGADSVLVHHGLFWRGQTGVVRGWLAQRLRLLLAHDINLLAYHLPLDAHAQWGNNAQLALALGWISLAQRFGDQDLGWVGQVQEQSLNAFAAHLAQGLQRTPVVVGDGDARVRRIGWCSGGAQNYFEAAVAAGVDVFVTGEISEPQAHLARESGVGFIAAGHHATERYGVQALGQAMGDALGVRYSFIDVDNPA